MPETNYNFEFDIQDVFGNKEILNKQIVTKKMESDYVTAFPMQQNYSITPSSNTKLAFGAKNILYVDVSVCKMDERVFVDNFNKRYNTNFNKNVRSELQSKRIELPSKYWINNYFNIDIKEFYENPIGICYFNVSSFTRYTFLTVTNMAVGEKRITPASYSHQVEAQLSSLKNIYF